MELQLNGMDALIAKLKNTQQRMSGPEMKRAIRRGANVIRDAMEEAAPVLEETTPGSSALEPGALKAGMRVFVEPNVEPVEMLVGPGKDTAHVARFVEYGHRQVKGGYSKVLPNGKTRGPGKAWTDVPAHPFLRPAFESSVAAAGDAIAESLKKSFEEVTS